MNLLKAHTSSTEITRDLAEFARRLTLADLDAELITVARHCILDWLGVTIAAVSEDVVEATRAQVLEDGGAAHATLLPTAHKVAAPQAALVNGIAGHALDFDDVLRPLRGHPTAPVLPAVLALAEKTNASGAALLAAFAGGIEVAARVGALLGDSHYEAGWHSTATVGTFGAAAGCAALLGLDGERSAHALGLAGIQAAGLKAGFGSMAKPYQVGKAAANGLTAAEMAMRGVTSRPDILECAQGVGATQTQSFDGAALDGLGATWLACDVLFKYHAACYGTHAPIEAAARRCARTTPSMPAPSSESSSTSASDASATATSSDREPDSRASSASASPRHWRFSARIRGQFPPIAWRWCRDPISSP